jgi:acetyl-CoA acetyltransferase
LQVLVERFKDEIVPFSIAQKKGDPIVFANDEFINKKTSAEALAGLRPATLSSPRGLTGCAMAARSRLPNPCKRAERRWGSSVLP